jgi:hypothetical protein
VALRRSLRPRRGPAELGRFDLADGRGACYFGASPQTALLESMADPDELASLIDRADLAARKVWTGPVARPPSVVDTCSHEATAAGITSELGTITPYETTWAWADAFDIDQRGGVRYASRFDPEPHGLCVVGPAGAPEIDGPRWPPLDEEVPALDWADWFEDLRRLIDAPALDDLVRAPNPES